MRIETWPLRRPDATEPPARSSATKMKAIGCSILLAVTTGGPAWAGQGDGFSFQSPLVLGFGRDSGLAAPGAPSAGTVDDAVLQLQPPALTYQARTGRTELSLSYQPELELFVENRELSAWNHAAETRLSHRVTRRLTLGAANVFLSTEDPARHLQQTTFLTERERYLQNTLSFDLGYRWHRRTSVGFRVDGLMSRRDSAGGSGFSEPAAIGWSVSLSRALDARQGLALSYSLLQSVELDADAPTAEEGVMAPTHNLAFSYQNTLGRGMSGGVAAGVITGAAASYSLSGRLEKTLGSFRVAAGYDRGLAFYGERRFPEPSTGATNASGLDPADVFESVRLDVEGELGSDVALSLNAWAARRGSSLGDAVDGGGESLWGRMRLRWRLTERLAAFVSAEVFAHQEGLAGAGPMTRQRYVAGVEVGRPSRRGPGAGFGALGPQPRRERER